MPYADPKVRAEKQVGYRETYKQKHPKYWENWNQKRDKPTMAKWQRDWRANNPREVMVINARARAKKAGYPCTITVDDIDWVTHCPIFGLELDYNSTPTGKRMHAKRAAFPTLDKRDPFLGYTPGNVFVLSAKANRMKQDATVDQLRALLRYAEGAA